MKLLLRRITVFLAVLGAAAFIGSLAIGGSMQHNRDARAEHYSREVIPAEKKAMEDWDKKRASLETEKHPGTIARFLSIDTTALKIAQNIADTYDPPYSQLRRYQRLLDVMAMGFFALCIFSSTAFELVRRREKPV